MPTLVLKATALPTEPQPLGSHLHRLGKVGNHLEYFMMAFPLQFYPIFSIMSPLQSPNLCT